MSYFDTRLRDNNVYVTEMIRRDWNNLNNASNRLKNDKETVSEAVKKHGFALQYASKELRNDKEIVLEAIRNEEFSLKFASEELRNDKEFIRYLLENVNKNFFTCGDDVVLLGDQLQLDPDFLKEIFPQNMSITSRIETLPFFKEEVKEEEEKNDLNSISECFEKVLKNRKMLEAFPCGKMFHMTPFTYSSIGFGISGITYGVDFNSSNFENNYFKQNNTTHILVRELFECMKTQNCTDFGSGDYLTSFVVKIYHDPFLKEEDRIKMMKKDRLSIPYHKNVASILFHRNDENIDIEKFRDEHDKKKIEFWERRVPSEMTEIQTGVLIMKNYKQDLFQYMKKRIYNKQSIHRFSVLEFCRIMKGIIHGVFHLHSHFIVHRDLHPGNIFINELYGRVWVGDFGCCLDLRERGTASSNPFLVHKSEEIMYSAGSGSSLSFRRGGYLKYLAPEIVNFDEENDEYLDYSKSDMYSVGILSLFLIYSSEAKVKLIGNEWRQDFEFIYNTSPEKWSSELSVLKCFSSSTILEFTRNHIIEEVTKRFSFFESKEKIDQITERIEEEKKIQKQKDDLENPKVYEKEEVEGET